MAQLKEEKKEEDVDWVSKVFTSRFNGTLTSIGKHAMNWLVWNKNDNIYWNFDLKQKASTKYVAFTMDDSPGHGLKGTIELLDFLKELNIQITFFIISSMVRDPITKEVNPDAAKVLTRMVQDGHELGNHAVADEVLLNIKESEYEQKIQECEDTIRLFDKSFGENGKVKWYRPPSGTMSKLHYDVLTRFGYRIAMANKYGRDTRNCTASNYLFEFYTRDVEAGDILIIHTPDEGKGDRYELLKTVKRIIGKLHDDGIVLGTWSSVYEKSLV